MIKRMLTAVVLLGLLASPVAAQDLTDDPRVASAIRTLEVWLEAQRAYEDVPGLSMSIVHDQDVVWKGAFGYANRAAGIEASPGTLYSICSISKLFTSVAVMQQRDAGQLHLDDAVGKHLDWFSIEQAYPGSPPITIERLLTHSSGLPRESDFPYWTQPDYPFPSREAIVERLSTQETLYPSAKYFQYSNLGLSLAGEIVTAASGEPFGDYVQARILDPLGLEDTSPEIPEAEKGGRLAMGYGARGRGGERSELEFFQVRGIAPAAGFASTVEDLARFASWQFRLFETNEKEVLDANTLREMHRVHWVDPDWETHWGLGFSTWRRDDHTFVGHGGGCPGFRSQLLIQPDDKIATIVMTNGIDVNSGKYTRVAYSIMAPAIKNALESPGEGEALDPALEIYTGTYDATWGGEIAVLPHKDGLGVIFLPTDDPTGNVTRLKKTGEHTFARVRDDDELGEEFRFDVEDGVAVRFWRHSNYYERAGG